MMMQLLWSAVREPAQLSDTYVLIPVALYRILRLYSAVVGFKVCRKLKLSLSLYFYIQRYTMMQGTISASHSGLG